MTSHKRREAFFAVRAGAQRDEADIYRLYAEIRRFAPLWRSPWGDVYLSSFDLVEQALTSRAMSHALEPEPPNRNLNASPIAHWLMFMDGADHLMIRRALQGPFAAGNGSLARRVAAIVNDQMGALDRNCTIDAVARFARVIPARVIGSMLGIPSTDLPLLHAWSVEIRTTLDTGMASITAGNNRAALDLTDYFRHKLEHMPGSAVIGDFNLTDLVAAFGVCTTAANLAFLAFAGYETTVHLLGSMLLQLSRAPDVWCALREVPDLGPSVVSETLRLESPVQKICRWALADIEFTGGHALHAGDNAVLLLGAANRDPVRFPDPDNISLSRAQTAHVGFGKGPHACLGRGLAMMEAVAVLRWLAANIEAIVVDTGSVDWIPNSSFRGLQRLPITLRC